MLRAARVGRGRVAAGVALCRNGEKTVNEWRTDKPPKHLHVYVWWGVVAVEAYWTGAVWRDVATYAVLRDVTHWRYR